MKKINFYLFALLLTVCALPALAADLMVASTMQRCNGADDCQLVTNSCADNCGFVPVNKANMGVLEQLYQTRCGKPMEANPSCNMNPPISAACINNRCTIDYAYAHNAGPQDYQSGAYPVPEAAVPNQVPGDYSHVNDRHGFTAYDLPQADIKKDTMGQIVTKVYVPSTAPVSGENYVPVDSTSVGTVPVPTAPTAPYAPTTNAAPEYVPAPVPSSTMAPPASPTGIPAAAVPSANSYATPPVMTPSHPNQIPPTSPEFVPADTAPSLPAPGLPPAPVAPPTAGDPVPAIPAVGASGVPQAPANAVPIPPSDLKPAPTFVPPAGTAIPVSPEDPGAPPPEGSTLIPPNADGTMGISSGTGMPSPAPQKKSFAGEKKEKLYN